MGVGVRVEGDACGAGLKLEDPSAVAERRAEDENGVPRGEDIEMSR